MAAHRYWRITGIFVQSHLDLTDARLLVEGVVPTPAPTISATFAPSSGTLSTLLNGTATDVVSWDASIVRLPSFALVFDTGAGGVDNPGLRLGAASSPLTFPKDLIIQYSDDGFEWANHQSYVELAYPGNLSLTGFATVVPTDSNYDNVQLLLKGDGGDGSRTFIDQSPSPNTFTANGDVQISTAQSKFGGSSIYFDGTGDYLSFTATQLLGTGDFTIECWVRLAATSGDTEVLCIGSITDNSQFNLLFECNGGGVLRGVLRNGTGGNNVDIESPSGSLTANTWTHIAFTVSGTTARVFVGGTQKASGTVSGTRVQNITSCRIGLLINTLNRPFNGYIDDLRVTKGVARYTADFSVPTSTFPTTGDVQADNLLVVSPLVPRPLTFAHTSDHIAGADLDDTAASPVRATCIIGADVENGGTGRIYGTTKEKNTPANTPLSRRVILVDERSRLVIRQTWSDRATGAFEFRDLAMGRPYTTISYDHLHNYRAVIADNQLPELQA